MIINVLSCLVLSCVHMGVYVGGREAGHTSFLEESSDMEKCEIEVTFSCFRIMLMI